jgi:transposase
MVMRLLVAAALVALPVASSAERATQFEKSRDALRADCPPPPGHQYVLDPGKALKPRKLTELPPAENYAAVLRRDERGCMVLVRYRDVRR